MYLVEISCDTWVSETFVEELNEMYSLEFYHRNRGMKYLKNLKNLIRDKYARKLKEIKIFCRQNNLFERITVHLWKSSSYLKPYETHIESRRVI